MKWLFYEKETEERARVVLFYPYEPTTVDMYDGYVFVENYQEPENFKNKRSITYCNPLTGEYWYEYEDIPKTEEGKEFDKLREDMNESVMELTMLIAMGGMM